MTFGESPMADQVPAADRDKIMHVRDDDRRPGIDGSDAPPDRYEPMKGFFSVAAGQYCVPRPEKISKPCREGHVSMPIQKTFWA